MSKFYAERKEYMEHLGKALAPLRDFGGLAYLRQATTQAEYLKIYTIFGDSTFLDITAIPAGDVFMDICRIMLKQPLESCTVCDLDTKRRIAPLFTHTAVIGD